MKVCCSRNQLMTAAASLSRIVPSRPALPVLNGLLITGEADRLVLQGTDLELSLTITVPAKVEEPGQTVILARPFDTLIRRLPEGELVLTWNEITRQVEVSFAQGRASLETWPASDYPPLQPAPRGLDTGQQELVIEGARWKDIVRKVLFAAASQDVRPQFAGVYFEFKEDSLVVAATDTYRLALYRLPCTQGLSAGLFIPVRALGELNRLLEDQDQLRVAWEQNLVSFQTARFCLTARLLESQFPAYERVIPGRDELRVEVERKALLYALERASLFAAPTDTFAVAEVTVEENSLRLAAQAAQVGSYLEEIPLAACSGAEYQEMRAFFNTHFLLEPLKVMDNQEISLGLNGSSGPAVYREEGEGSYLHLVLPVCRAGDGVS
ncbi:MAG: DNA polymerase III subunit beta [Firmicutes bacterium]|nr:DNA polymerase III subunit beta [Bacillota bacterium]